MKVKSESEVSQSCPTLRQAGPVWGQAVELRRQLCSGQDDSQKQSGASGAAKGTGSGGGTAGSASVLRGCWDFRRATSVWQLHYNMYLKALKISATIKPPLPPVAGVHWDPEWAALGPSRLGLPGQVGPEAPFSSALGCELLPLSG